MPGMFQEPSIRGRHNRLSNGHQLISNINLGSHLAWKALSLFVVAILTGLGIAIWQITLTGNHNSDTAKGTSSTALSSVSSPDNSTSLSSSPSTSIPLITTLSTLSTSTLLASLSSTSTASTVPTSTPVPPPIRTTSDGCYLVNCQSDANGNVSSGVAYYQNISISDNQDEDPTDYQVFDPNSYADWTGANAVFFPTHSVTFRWDIDADAASQEVYAAVGKADNGYHNWTVYKDTGKMLYGQDGASCNAMYWAF